MLAYKMEVVENTVVEFNGTVVKDMKKVVKGYKKSKKQEINALDFVKVEINEKEQMVVTYVSQDLTIQKAYNVNDAMVKNVSAFLLPIKTLKDIKYIKNEESFTIEVVDFNKVVINRDGVESTIETMNVESFVDVNHVLFGNDYIEFETKEYGNNLLNKKDLKVFLKAGKTVSTTETRPVLTNIALEKGNVISTDSHRLFKGETILEEIDSTIMLPVELFDRANDLSDKNDLFTLFFSENNHVKIQSDNLIIVERTVMGNYPQTDRLIPNDFRLEIKIEKVHQFLTTISSVKNAMVRLTFNKSEQAIDLHIHDKENKQEVKTTMPVIVENDLMQNDFKITFSAKFMMDAIQQMEKNYLSIAFQSNMRPFIVSNDKNQDISLILPIRTY
jgi:DNA polymerase III subunit beta